MPTIEEAVNKLNAHFQSTFSKSTDSIKRLMPDKVRESDPFWSKTAGLGEPLFVGLSDSGMERGGFVAGNQAFYLTPQGCNHFEAGALAMLSHFSVVLNGWTGISTIVVNPKTKSGVFFWHQPGDDPENVRFRPFLNMSPSAGIC